MGEIRIFDKGEKPQTWFDFDEDTEVLIELTEKEDLEEIRSTAIRQAKLARSENSDNIGNILLGKRKVKGWRKKDDPNHPGLVVNGEPFPYSEKNVAFLMQKSLDFSAFVNDVCIKLKLFSDADRGEQIKNS